MPYIPRLTDPLLREMVEGLPAVLVTGPRACGKTTSAKKFSASVLPLDRPAVRQAADADPDTAIAGEDEPLLLDEWQFSPDILGAVKRAVDHDSQPGRFILTGSLSHELSPAGWPMAGRVTRFTMWGLTQREIAGNTQGESIIDVLFDKQYEKLSLPESVPDLLGYLECGFKGMLPEVALQESERLRAARLESYIDQAVNHDLLVVSERRDPGLLRKYLVAAASMTAGVPTHKKMYDAAGITRGTAAAYDAVLESIFMVEQVPAWASNRLHRLARAPKRYLTDPSFLAPLLGVNTRALKRDADLLGRFVDTFVMAQLRPEMVISHTRVDPFHLRTDDGGHEIDLLLAARDGRLVPCEIKATAAPKLDDAQHVLWLKRTMGEAVVVGVVFHTGPKIFRLAPEIWALPLATLWGRHG